jgi:hypothetical protein
MMAADTDGGIDGKTYQWAKGAVEGDKSLREIEKDRREHETLQGWFDRYRGVTRKNPPPPLSYNSFRNSITFPIHRDVQQDNTPQRESNDTTARSLGIQMHFESSLGPSSVLRKVLTTIFIRRK